MRHLKAGRKLGRTSAHRKAMYSNMVAALVTYGKIETTEAKAKELRSIADRTINWGVGVNDLLGKDRKKLSRNYSRRLASGKYPIADKDMPATPSLGWLRTAPKLSKRRSSRP